MGLPNENILRRHCNKKPVIITFAVLIVILFLLVSFGYYAFLDYEYKNGEVTDFAQTMIAISNMASGKYILPFTFDVFFKIIEFQISIWYIYLAALVCIFIYMTSRSRNDFKNMEHGSARWANKEEISSLQKDTSGIPLGKDTYLPLDSSVVSNLNEIVIGGSGAGKTFRKVKPDILQMNGSYVITDPKGELYRDCAKVLRQNGYVVKVLNLVNINYSNSYNPFAYIVSEQDVVNVASLFMKNTAGEGEKEDFFSGAALKLLIALMMYLYKSEPEIKTFGRVIRLLNSIRYKNGAIDMSCELAICLNKHATLYPNDAATINWNGMQSNAQETQSSINEVLSTRLSLWSTTDLDAITSTDEMNFDEVGATKTAIFLIIPAARNTYRVVVNLFYSQLFERLMRVAENKYNGALPLLVNCELDEFANIGEIPAFNETLSVVRSYNIRICIILQGISQLKAAYEKTFDAIIGNCDTFTFLGSKDKETLDYVSEKLDKITVRNDSRTYNRGAMQGNGGQDTEAVSERPLLYPSEIKAAIKPKGKNKKYGGNAIIFLGYEYPMLIPKFDTVNHPLFFLCGSKYTAYVHNNTDVATEYNDVWQKRIQDYHSMYEKQNDLVKQEQVAYIEQIALNEEENQKELCKQFDENNPIVAPDPVRPPTKAEYEDYVLSSDRADYVPVPDFDDTAEDDLFDDIAPVVEMLEMMGGDE